VIVVTGILRNGREIGNDDMDPKDRARALGGRAR
jgi:hypothetical protein